MRKFLAFIFCIVLCSFFVSCISEGLPFENYSLINLLIHIQASDESDAEEGSGIDSSADAGSDASSANRQSNCAQAEVAIQQGSLDESALKSKNIESYLSSDYYPYYASLDSASKNVYRQVLAGLETGQEEIRIKKGVNEEKSKAILTYVFLDHPQLFWCTGSCSYRLKGNKLASVQPEYNSLVDDLDATQSQVSTSAQALVDETANMDDFEAERYFHDYLCGSVSYESGDNDQNIYSVFVDGASVCAGYTRAFQYLMQLRGIPCYYCSGNSENPLSGEWEGHAWNIVKLSDSCYNVDVTWDDSLNESDRDLSLVVYTYFNRTDEDFAADHDRDEDGEVLPSCNGTEFSYESYYGHSWDEDLSEQVTLSTATPVTSLDEYTLLWESTFESQGAGTHDLTYVVHGSDTLNAIKAEIDGNSMDGYIGTIAAALGLNGFSYSTSCTSYDLGDENYFISQSMTIQ